MQREYSTKVLAIRSPLLNYPMAQPEFQHIEKDDSWGDTHMRVYKEDNGGGHDPSIARSALRSM